MTDNTPPQIKSITLSQSANIKAGTTFTMHVGVVEPNGDLGRTAQTERQVCQRRRQPLERDLHADGSAHIHRHGAGDLWSVEAR